jgi:hypothetical protein
MNRYFSTLLLVALLGLGAVAASAQISAPVYVPFAFTANHHLLPAGTYKVELLSDHFVAMIDSQTGKSKGIVLVRPEAGTRIEPVGGLVFASYGSTYVLKEVRMTGSSTHSELAVQPKPEPLSAKSSTKSTFTVAMR